MAATDSGDDVVFTLMTLATLITVTRTVASPETRVENKAPQVSRIIIGGVLATGALLAAEPAAPLLVRRFAALVFVTSLLVHGVAFAQALNRIVAAGSASAPTSAGTGATWTQPTSSRAGWDGAPPARSTRIIRE